MPKATYFLYILYSQEIDKYHIGHTSSYKNRLTKDKIRMSRFSKRANDWKIVYVEVFKTKQKVLERVISIKKMKSRDYIEQLIEDQLHLNISK